MSEQTQAGLGGLSSKSPASGAIKKIFTFDTFYTPKVITLVYWFMCLGSVISGIGIMNTGYRMSAEFFFLGLIAIVGGIIGARIVCELVIVLFKINENLKLMAEQSSKVK